MQQYWTKKQYNYKTGVINDPLSQAHSPVPLVAITIFACKLFCGYERWGLTDGRHV